MLGLGINKRPCHICHFQEPSNSSTHLGWRKQRSIWNKRYAPSCVNRKQPRTCIKMISSSLISYYLVLHLVVDFLAGHRLLLEISGWELPAWNSTAPGSSTAKWFSGNPLKKVKIATFLCWFPPSNMAGSWRLGGIGPKWLTIPRTYNNWGGRGWWEWGLVVCFGLGRGLDLAG